MASLLRRIGGGAGDGGDKKGGDGRKRLSTVQEGDEAAELAKLAAAEAEVRRLEEEIERVQAQLTEVGAIFAEWEQNHAAFAALSVGKQRRYKDPDGYLVFLEKERSELREREASLRNQMGGSLHKEAAQTGAVTEV